MIACLIIAVGSVQPRIPVLAIEGGGGGGGGRGFTGEFSKRGSLDPRYERVLSVLGPIRKAGRGAG